MNKKSQSVLAVLIAAVIALTVFCLPVTTSAAGGEAGEPPTTAITTTTTNKQIPMSGVCGDNITWKLDAENYELKIQGNGDMYDDVFNEYYWRSLLGDSVKKITISDGITSIGKNAFKYCEYVEKIILGKDIETIKSGAFWTSNCIGEVFFNGSLSDWCSIKFESSVPNKKFYIDDAEVINLVLTDDVTEIPQWAFRGFVGLKTVTIPKDVKKIGELAFSGCANLDTIRFNAVNCDNDDGLVFSLCSSVRTIYIDEKVEILPENIFQGCYNVELAVFPDTVINISDLAFSGCSKLVIKCKAGSYANYYADRNGIETILTGEVGGDYRIKNRVLIGFENGNGAKNIIVPSNVSTVGYAAFRNNAELESVELPFSVTQIYGSAFEECSALEKVIIPYTVTSIGENAFGHTNATIVCYNGSYAHKYAKENCIDFELLTLNFSTDNLVLNNGESKLVTVQPSHAVACGVPSSFESQNPNVATVDANGNVTAVSAGTVQIAAVAPNGAVLGVCNVTVYSEPIELIIKTPSTTTVNYGDTLVLHAELAETALPEGYSILWTVEGTGVDLKQSTDGLTCEVTSVQNGNVTVKATIVDENGEALIDTEGNEISAEQNLNSKVNFWQKIVSFFKNLFRISRIILQSK